MTVAIDATHIHSIQDLSGSSCQSRLITGPSTFIQLRYFNNTIISYLQYTHFIWILRSTVSIWRRADSLSQDTAMARVQWLSAILVVLGSVLARAGSPVVMEAPFKVLPRQGREMTHITAEDMAVLGYADMLTS